MRNAIEVEASAAENELYALDSEFCEGELHFFVFENLNAFVHEEHCAWKVFRLCLRSPLYRG